ncbi:pneumococcal serine-rich repeat protein isoform X1 [Drosophila sulfurigaster albostrigata]|uniref:pneumococcal serine-rich repeat protein isoform X1 n=1 Tax=Drosophila sulfurigaster albostrigata TaxID=89887 RepID=UPI002D21A663|nr:pneumococcal serine-rich repeat protein isoform X1 [Drosophila sulfurigaster albostrigata]XP_062130124.1 pneumococcal serine-rich repeat protein isoform X1 [Drosophila sulfurigaster albostrigata]
MSASSEGGSGGPVGGGGASGTATTTAPATLKAVKIRTHPTNTKHLIAHNTATTTANINAMAIPTYSQFRGALNRYSLHQLPTSSSGHSTVAAKITHVKPDGGGGISITGTPILSGGTIKVATAGNTVQTSLSGTPISLNTGQATTAASIRAIGAGGQSTQVRVVMPMIKQLENVTATGRTQITAIPATPAARSVSNASITVTRPVTQATYLPRASVTATQMSGVGVTGAQRLVTPLRATSTASVNPASGPTGLGSSGSFVRTSQPSTVISSASSAAWMQSPTAVQLIRAIHQPRQRIITTSTGASVSTTATPVQANTALSVSAAQSLPPQQAGPSGVPQAYVATVLPPRPHQATLVYSSNVSAAGSPTTNPNTGPQFNPRFAVATPLGATNAAGGTATTPGGTTVTPRQVRPILGKSFPTAKLNTTSISIRAPSIPQLSSSVAPPTPVSVSGGVTVAGRGPGGAGTAASVAPVALTANLPTTRIIQLQQPATGGGQQIIGSTARLAGNVMLQPFLMSTTQAAKMGIRPPVTMTAKVQPSLTITQLNPIGKLSTAGGAAGATMQPQGVASIQAVPSVSATSVTTSSVPATTGATAAAGGATVLPLTLGARGGPASNILTGTLTPIKNASGITVGKMMIPQAAGVDASGSGGLPPGTTPTNVFIQQRGGNAGAVSVSAATATSVATSVAGTSFLPQGSSAIYYESMPASTGVLSLTTTTVTQSTHTHGQQAQAQLVSSGASGSLSVSSLPFASHAQAIGSAAGGSTATFTVLPSSAAGGSRTIGHQQLIIPAGAAHAGGAPPQHMVIPLHTSVKVTTGAAPTTTGGGATVSALPMPIPVPVAANALVSNFMRKRDAEGSPIRGVKNLAPTLLSMSSNANATNASTASVTAVNLAGGSAFNLQPVSVAPAPQIAAAAASAGATVTSSALTVEALAKKERERVNSAIVSAAAAVASSASTASASTTAGSIVSTRNMRAESPASSDGSTTVSANSSPGVDQQIQDSNLSINRIGDEATSSTATHFNPINEMYATHQSTLPPNMSHSTLVARVGSAFVDVSQLQGAHHVASSGQLPQTRMNGNSYDGLARKKARRSTNDSQHSNQSQASLSLSLPPPTGSVSSHSSSTTQEATSLFIQQQQQQQQQQQLQHQPHNNGGLLVTAAAAGGSVAVTTNASSNAADVNNHRLASSATPAVAGNKENANPVDFVLRRPRNCALLNTYKPTHKLANNHFHRYTDVKPREERRATVIDLANQPNVQGKISGWKLYHLRSQMEDLNDSEMFSLGQLETMLKELEKDKDKHGDIERVSELLKGNIQRSKIITDGINEAQNQLMKIFDHKPHVTDIINRLQSKRNFKKREKL